MKARGALSVLFSQHLCRLVIALHADVTVADVTVADVTIADVTVPEGSSSRGGDVAVYVFDINRPSLLPTLF